MDFYGAFGHPEFSCDHLVWLALGKQAQDIELTRGEAASFASRGRRRRSVTLHEVGGAYTPPASMRRTAPTITSGGSDFGMNPATPSASSAATIPDCCSADITASGTSGARCPYRADGVEAACSRHVEVDEQQVEMSDCSATSVSVARHVGSLDKTRGRARAPADAARSAARMIGWSSAMAIRTVPLGALSSVILVHFRLNDQTIIGRIGSNLAYARAIRNGALQYAEKEHPMRTA